MHTVSKLIPILFFALICSPLAGQKCAVDTSAYWLESDFTIENYNSTNVLSQNSIKTLLREENGLLWMATEAGLECFDGQQFVSFNFADTYRNRIKNIYSTKDDVFFGKQFKYRALNGHLVEIPSNNFDKQFILGSNNSFIGRFNYSSFDALGRYYSSMKLDGLSDLIRISDSSFYITNSKEQRLLCFNKADTIGSIQIQKSNVVTPYGKEPYFMPLNKYLMSLTQAGKLVLYDGIDVVYECNRPKLKADWQHLVLSSDQEKVYAHSGENLYELEFNNGVLTFRLLIENLGIPSIREVQEFGEGNFYIGTSTNGLYILRRKKFYSNASQKIGISASVYAHVSIGRDSLFMKDKLLIGDKMIEAPWPLYKISDKQLLVDSKNQLWFGTNNSGVVIDLKNLSIKDEITQKGRLFREDKNGLIWSIFRDSIWSFDSQKWRGIKLDVDMFHRNDGFFYNAIDHGFWITNRANAYFYNIKKNELKKSNSLSELYIRNIYTDHEGYNWINTFGNGIYVFKDDRLIKLPQDKNSYLKVSHCILEDDEGFFWISSNNGLFKVLRQELIAFVEGNVQNVYYHKYDNKDGIINSEFNGGCFPCALKIEKNEFSFPTLKGVVKFNPYELTYEKHNEDIIISKLVIDDREHSLDSLEKLDQGFSRLEFTILTPYEGNHDNVYLAYKLEGLNEGWTNLKPGENISFSQIGYGNYTLKIRRKLGFGINNFSEISKSFYVKPFLYQKMSFKVVVFILSLLAIISIIVLRLRTTKRQREELEGIIQRKTNDYRLLNEKLKLNVARLRKAHKEKDLNIKTKDKFMGLYTHDIRGPLRFILSIIDNSDDLDKINTSDIQDRFEIIKSSTKGIYLRTERMFNWLRVQEDGFRINPRQFSLFQLTERVLESYQHQLKSKEIAITNKVSTKAKVFSDRNILFIIFNNLLDNAVKFSNSKDKIKVEHHMLDEFEVWVLTDSGVGIPEAKLKVLRKGSEQYSTLGTNKEEGKGYGLMAINELLKRIRGYMEIESTHGKGTVVSVFIRNIED